MFDFLKFWYLENFLKTNSLMVTKNLFGPYFLKAVKPLRGGKLS